MREFNFDDPDEHTTRRLERKLQRGHARWRLLAAMCATGAIALGSALIVNAQTSPGEQRPSDASPALRLALRPLPAMSSRLAKQQAEAPSALPSASTPKLRPPRAPKPTPRPKANPREAPRPHDTVTSRARARTTPRPDTKIDLSSIASPVNNPPSPVTVQMPSASAVEAPPPKLEPIAPIQRPGSVPDVVMNPATSLAPNVPMVSPVPGPSPIATSPTPPPGKSW